MTDDAVTSADEQRSPGPATAATGLAWNPLLGEYVAQAPARMQRQELSATCPFCDDLTSGRMAPGTQAWVRPNDFPALQPPVGESLIIIYSPLHDRTFAEMSVAEVLRIVGVWQQVYADLAGRYACVMTWETSGEAIGQTQRHPHGQAFGVSFLPDRIARELTAIERSEARGRGCPFCALVRDESGGPRVVVEGERWLGVVPSYARYPYEVHLYPRQHLSAITALGVAAAEELAASLLRVVRAYHRVYQGQMPYMLALHQLADTRFHLHVELLPVGRAPGKLKLAASAESAWGLWVNDSIPEAKAAELRALVAEERL